MHLNLKTICSKSRGKSEKEEVLQFKSIKGTLEKELGQELNISFGKIINDKISSISLKGVFISLEEPKNFCLVNKMRICQFL